MSLSSQRVGSWLQVASVVAASLAASSCAQTPRGEFTALECSDEDDNDGDMLSDCDDPDCWVFCPIRGNVEIGDASMSTPPDVPDAQVSPPKPDAGKPKPSADDDAGNPPPGSGDEDAGMPPATCDCAPDEMCVDGECRSNTNFDGQYTLSVRSAYVPLGPSLDRCFDYKSSACVARLPPLCDCERPDPYVVVVLNRSPVSKATTAPKLDTASPVWPDSPTVTIDLKASDQLTFRVFDSDGIGSDPPIFDCVPELSTLTLGSGVLSCNPRPGTTVTAPPGSNYFINVEVRRVVPDAAMP
jgi:C2 domain